MEPKFVGLSKAASILGISHRQLLNWAEQGIIPAYRPSPNGKYLVKVAEVEAAIVRHTARPQTPRLTEEEADEIIERVIGRPKYARSVKKTKTPSVQLNGHTVQTMH